jgi:phosphoribosylformylglycinamidine synthase
VLVLGTTRAELDGSAWAEVVHGHLGGLPPQLDLSAEQALAEVTIAAAEGGLLHSAHDLADGGLAQALAESAMRFGVGVSISLDEVTTSGVDAFEALFSESTGRVLVTLDPTDEAAFRALCAEHGVVVTALGQTTTEPALAVDGQFEITLAELESVWRSTLRNAFAA